MYSNVHKTRVHTEIRIAAELFIQQTNVNTLCNWQERPRAAKDALAGRGLSIPDLQPWTHFSSSETRNALSETCTSPKNMHVISYKI